MSRFSLQQLRIFTAIAEHGSGAAAARDLRLSPATLSEAVRDLEGNLGHPLFDRTNRRLTLTPAGWSLLRDAKRLLNQCDAMYRQHRGWGTLVFGASVTVGNYILSPVILALAHQIPDLHVELVIRNTEGIVQMLLRREIQAAVVEGAVAHPELEIFAWKDDELAVVAAPGHPFAAGASTADLAQARWVLRERGSGTRESFDAAARAWPGPPQVVMTAGGNEFIKQAVAAGHGLGCLSRAAVEAELNRGELVLVPIAGPPMVRALTFVRGRDASQTPPLAAFMRALGIATQSPPGYAVEAFARGVDVRARPA